MGYSHSSLRLQIKHIYINIMFAATQQIASVAGLKATKVQSKSISKVVKADIYPEFGTYPGGANPRSSRLATKRTPSVKSSTADGPNWASLAPGPPRTSPYPVVHGGYLVHPG